MHCWTPLNVNNPRTSDSVETICDSIVRVVSVAFSDKSVFPSNYPQTLMHHLWSLIQLMHWSWTPLNVNNPRTSDNDIISLKQPCENLVVWFIYTFFFYKNCPHLLSVSWPGITAYQSGVGVKGKVILIYQLDRKSKPFQSTKIKTSQELRMLSSVTLDCQVTKIVMNLGSQL